MPMQERPVSALQIKTKAAIIPSYTADGYEPSNEDEWDDIHVEIECRQFQGHNGKRTSKPRILKINTMAWPKWYANRNAGGFSINAVLHRPAGVPPIKADAWDDEEVEAV